jgi:hypothetical protein
MNLSNNFINNS